MSHVAMGRKQCPVCLEIHDNGAEILLHRQLKDIKDQVTGHHLCEEHEQQEKDGFIFFIEISNTPDNDQETIRQENANRTGHIMSIKREAAEGMFNREVELFNFVEEGVIKLIQEQTNHNEDV